MSRTMVGVRLGPAELQKLDAIVSTLAQRNPDIQPTRSDALRVLLANSGSVMGALVTASTHPPRHERAA